MPSRLVVDNAKKQREQTGCEIRMPMTLRETESPTKSLNKSQCIKLDALIDVAGGDGLTIDDDDDILCARGRTQDRGEEDRCGDEPTAFTPEFGRAYHGAVAD